MSLFDILEWMEGIEGMRGEYEKRVQSDDCLHCLRTLESQLWQVQLDTKSQVAKQERC